MKTIYLLALALRLISLYLFKDVSNFDSQSYTEIGNLTLNNINIYPLNASFRFPYLPVFLYIQSLALAISNYFSIPQIIFIKGLNVVFDMGVLWLINKITKNKKTSLFYAVNPVSILITCLHGQFDIIPLFFLLLSLNFVKKQKEILGVLSLSLSIAIKTWPLIFLIIIYRYLKNKQTIFWLILFPVFFVIIYLVRFNANITDILSVVTKYFGLKNIWGISKVFNLITKNELHIFMSFIFIIWLFIYSFIIKKTNIFQNSYALLLFFFCFTIGYSIQYLIWLIPFLLISSKKIWFFIFLMTCHLVSYYSQWLFNWTNPTIQNLFDYLLWFYFVYRWYIKINRSSDNSKHRLL